MSSAFFRENESVMAAGAANATGNGLARLRALSPVAPLRAVVAVVLAACLLLAGCTSYEDRWGRDPAERNKNAPRTEARQIEIAKSEAMHEEVQPEADDLSPVSVLFVNGDPLTVEDVLKWIRHDLQRMAAALPPDEYRRQLLEVVKQRIRVRAESQMLSQVALRRMGEQEVERLDQFVDGRIREIINAEHGGRQTRYEDWLREHGLTAAADRARIRRELLVVAYLQRTVGDKVMEPTRRELEQVHREYVHQAQAGRKRHMLLIDIPYGAEDATGRTVSAPVPPADARRRAQTALERVRGGTDFAEVAREYSEGINATAGGDWGWVTREGLRPRWQPAVTALYELEEGQTSDIVDTGATLFIVDCAGVEESEIASFADMQRELVESYKNRQFELLSRELVADLYSQAEVRPENPARFLRAVVEAAPQPAPTVP